MAKLMDKQGVLDLAKKLIDANLGNFNATEKYLSHLESTYNIARETTNEINFKYSCLKGKLIPSEISLAGGLHDIGRTLNKNQLFHELRGARYIEQNGLELGVADSQKDVNRIVQMFRPHFVVAEQFADDKNADKRVEFEPIDSSLLIPRTWQEKIVVYADLSNLNGERVSVSKRIAYIQKRYFFDSELAETNLSLINTMNRGLLRVLEVCERVQKLKEGKLTEQKIWQYGFI